ncbi:MAG: D-tyrosyl-tRNA(Tyr) deacylase [Lachnospiraceae bacterium]|nr:D-tyrosyl-tRNA(Tyr) deacylase [Lachnospiraceae bacterium]
MRLLIQRVSEASVSVDNHTIGKIGHGYLVLLGIGAEDSEADADRLIQKMVRLRIFSDDDGRINLSLKDVGGSLLVVSQFTLYADTRHGNRPGFSLAAKPEKANALYEYFLARCRETVPVVEHGSFGAYMEVSLVNDGPFTVLLE